MVTGDAIFLGVLVLAASGLTLVAFLTRAALFYLMAGFMWPAVGIWVYTLVPSPVGNAALLDWTVLIVALMSILVFGKWVRDLMTKRQDGEERIRLAYRQRLDEITRDEWGDTDEHKQRAPSRVAELPAPDKPRMFEGTATRMIRELKRKGKW